MRARGQPNGLALLPASIMTIIISPRGTALVLFGLGAGAIAAAPTYAPTPRPIVNFGSCDKCKDNIYGKSVNIERDCGSMFRQKAAERWGKWRYYSDSGDILCSKDSCCAPNSKDCCEANGAVWAGLFGAFFVVLAGGYYIYKRTSCCTDDCCMEVEPVHHTGAHTCSRGRQAPLRFDPTCVACCIERRVPPPMFPPATVAPAPRAVPYVGPTSGRTRAASVPDGFPDDDWFISRCRPVPLK